MKIGEKVRADIVAAMKARDEHRVTTLRMVKLALENKEIDKSEALTDAEETQILTTLIKQRKESVEAFTKGGWPELAEKERLEIGMIEAYLQQAAVEEEIRNVWSAALSQAKSESDRLVCANVCGLRWSCSSWPGWNALRSFPH